MMLSYWYFKRSFYFFTTMPCTLLFYCAVYTHLWHFYACFMYIWFYECFVRNDEIKLWNRNRINIDNYDTKGSQRTHDAIITYLFRPNGVIIRLSTLKSKANDLLNDTLRLDNEPSAWAAAYSQSVREVQTTWAYKILHKIAKFIGVLLSSKIQLNILHGTFKSVFLIVTNLKWCDEPLLCWHRVKTCNFAMNKQRPGHYFHLHVRAPPTVVPGWVDERMTLSLRRVSTGLYHTHDTGDHNWD